MTRDEFEKQIIIKAVKDAAFREQLTKDPKGTLERELQQHKAGVALPANLQVTIVQETPDHIYLRLPVMPSTTMSEQELVGMSGGAGSVNQTVSNVNTSAVNAVSIDVTAAVGIDGTVAVSQIVSSITTDVVLTTVQTALMA